MNTAYRIALTVSLAVSGYTHSHLYIVGYQYIPSIGPAFLVQAGAFFAMSVLIIVGAPN